MKLNPDCIRDILLFLEENLSLTPTLGFQEIDYRTLSESLSYSKAEVVNTIITLDEAGFIKTISDYSCEGLEELDIYRITYDGYQFIETIRPETVWKKVRHVGTNIGSMSIDVITKIASSVITELVKAQLNLP